MSTFEAVLKWCFCSHSCVLHVAVGALLLQKVLSGHVLPLIV
jgi:hypothetical protein